MRVAIVGAGVSGLAVAYLLHRGHEIVVFEAADYAGGHADTIRVDPPNETHQVDTGFIVFNDRSTRLACGRAARASFPTRATPGCEPTGVRGATTR